MAAESEVKAEQINWHILCHQPFFDPLHVLSLGDSSEGKRQFLNRQIQESF